MELEDNARFCPNCGTFFRVDSVSEVEEVEETVENLGEVKTDEFVDTYENVDFENENGKVFFRNHRNRKPKKFTKKLRICCFILFAFSLWKGLPLFLLWELWNIENILSLFFDTLFVLAACGLFFGMILVLLNIHDFLEEIRDNMRKEKDENK
jgi:hypothetical protein